MAKKGQSKHQKRLSASPTLKLPRKTEPWITKPSPGPHSSESCIPLATIIRDYLEITRTTREANKILSEGEIQVDGRVRKNPKFPVGFMDIIQVERTGKSWRVTYDEKGYLTLHEIPEDESKFKLAKIEGKNQFKGGKIQLAFYDGKTALGDFKKMNIGDVAKLNLPELEVSDHLPLEEGKIALITGGSNVGKIGTILEIRGQEKASQELISLEVEGETLQAPEEYVFVIGEKKPIISLPGD